MRKFIQKKLKEQKGMTLIELLAVIVILAIIAAIAIPAIGGIIENSRVGAIKSDAQNIMSAGELYFIDEEPDSTGTLSVNLKELEDGGFIEDSGSFEDAADKTKVTVNKVGSAATTFSGTGSTGGIQVVFNKATRDAIATYSNSERTAIDGVKAIKE